MCSAPPVRSSTGRARVLWVLCDGIGDVGVPSLGRKTPLQSCDMTCCDAIAAAGVSGLMDPVQAGLACGSDTAHLSMFGYDPRQYYRGRGAFETMGAGLDMQPGDIAFKDQGRPTESLEGVRELMESPVVMHIAPERTQCNFAYLNLSTVEVELRRADRNFEDVGPTLCKMLDGQEIPSFPNHSVAVKYATEHRCGVRVRGPGLSDNVTGTDPLKDNLPLRESMPLDSSEEAALTARLVNALSRHITEKLQQHPINRQRIEQGKPPANCVLLRGCGARVKVPTFIDLHGIKPFMIAPTCLIRGLGASLEMDIIDVPGGTGDYFTDLSAKAAYALRAFADKEKAYDLGFVHVKAVDDAGHDRSLPRKFEFLRKFDDMTLQLVRGLAALEQQTGDRVVVCVTGDHSTPVDYGDHSAEPVPFSIAAVRDVLRHLDKDTQGGGQRAPCDDVKRFDEISAARGALGRFQGMQVLGIIKRFCALTCGNGGGIGMGSHGRDARECSKGEICAETQAKIRKIDAFSSAPPKRN